MKKIFTIIFFLLFSSPLFSQTLTWQRLYDGPPSNSHDNGRAICEALSGNFYVAGYITTGGIKATILKLKPNGDTIWVKNVNGLQAYAMTPSGDGGCVVTGQLDSACIVKLDSNGNIVWLKKYGRSGIQIYDIIKTSDGGFVACGRTPSFDPGYGYVLKTDSLGILQWQREYVKSFFTRFNSVTQAHDGGFLITGFQTECELCNGYSFVFKLNNNGDSLWVTAEQELIDYVKICKIKSGYLIGATIRDTAIDLPQVCFLKINLNGNIIFQKTISYNNQEVLKDIKAIYENRYVIAAETDTSDFRIGGTYVTDSLGNILHRNLFSPTDHTRFFSISPFINGDIGFVGTAQHKFAPNSRDIYVVRTDSTLFAKPVSINNSNILVFKNYKLYQNYPNPFNPSTMIKFDVVSQSFIKIKIFDLIGREISTLVNEKLSSGTYEIEFNADGLSSGIYFYQLKTNEIVIQSRKMVLIR